MEWEDREMVADPILHSSDPILHREMMADSTLCKGSEDVSDEAMRETMKDIEKLSELIKDVVPVYNFAKPHEKEKIIRIIFSELHVSQDVL